MRKGTLNIRSMSVDALLKLRDEIGVMLSHKGRELQRQLERLGVWGPAEGRSRTGHPRKGVKVAPKYRGPNGETWAGRGATPRWLAALIKDGHKRDEFLISSTAKTARSRKRANVKKSGRTRSNARH